MKKLFLVLLFPFLHFSCQKVIDLKLNNATSQIVIQGEVNDAAGPYQISISKSIAFYADNVYPNVSGAVVMITDSTEGVTDSLSETTPGIYNTHKIIGKPGNTYLLEVNGVKIKELYVFDDRLSDGRYIRDKMDNDSSDIKKGYSVKLSLIGIDKNVHSYLSKAVEIAYNNNNLIAPATPVSNISGGSLGYFSAETISSKSGVVKYFR